VLANVFLGVPLPLSSFEMIYICIITDVFPSLSLIYEKPEADLMTRPPKNKSRMLLFISCLCFDFLNFFTEKLVNWKLLVQAYMVTGNLESFFAFLSFFLYMSWYGNIGPSHLFLAYPLE
jgi:sodium/potassium-transporting ATPase subunit alpha